MRGRQTHHPGSITKGSPGFQRTAANQMFQLAYIARPIVRQQRRLPAGVQAQASQTQTGTVLLQKITGQQQHIMATLAQRRHNQGVDAEPVIEVCAVTSGAYLLGQVAVACGDHPHIDLVLAVRTQALQLPALQRAQQLGLYRKRQLADFVKKQGAAIGLLELAAPVGHSA